MMRKRHRILKRFMLLILLAAIAAGVMNIMVLNQVSERIYSVESIFDLPEADCVMALGALVHPGQVLSWVLSDRVQTAIDVYNAEKAKKILLSGDHQSDDYDEVGAMLAYCLERGVPAEDIFCDHYGLNTYDSMKRAKEAFGVKTMIISTQDFHVSRAVYIASGMDIEAYGVNATLRQYGPKTDVGQPLREVVARAKDFITTNIIKPEARHTGDIYDISGDGRVTHTRE